MSTTTPVEILGPIIIAIALMIVPLDLTTPRRVAAALIVLGSIPLGMVSTAVVPRRWATFAGSMVRIFVVTGLVAFTPPLWTAGLVFVAVVVASSAAIEPRPDAVYLAVVGSAGLIAAALMQDRNEWIAPNLLLIIMCFSVRQWTAEWHRQRIETDRQFDDLVDTANLFFWEVDPSARRVVSITGNSYGTLGYHPDEIMALNWLELIVPEDRPLLMNALNGNELLTQGRLDLTIRLVHSDGHWVTLRQLIRQNEKGQLIGASIDISELASATEALRHQAHHDTLTGLANRLLLTETLNEAFESLETDATGSADEGLPRIALLLFDLDGFKGINDTLGHATGDRVLQVLAERFKASLGDEVLLARVGGDEFALVLSGQIDAADALKWAERLVDLIQDPLRLAGLRLSVKSSVGVALAPDHATDADELLQRADIALYQAKAEADSICLYESTPDEISMERLQLSTDINDALDRGEFELWYQPKVDLMTGQTTGVEGLARWRHPERGVLMPGQFLPLLGVSGSYQRFTDQVVAQGIEFAGACHRAGQMLTMAINLGSVSFLDTGLPDRIAGLLEVHQVAAEYLFLEVTEDELLLDRDSSSEVFLALEQLGVQLSIDDFGTGYSSLSRLRGLQIQEVKIDRSFVSGLGVDPEDWAIVRTIIELARLLAKTTVAEGVETAEQVAILQSLGCDIGQGFYFDRAIPPDEVLGRISANGLGYEHLISTGDHHVVEGHPPKPRSRALWIEEGVIIATSANDVRASMASQVSQIELMFAAVELMPAAVWVKDAQARYVRANASLRDLMDIEHESAIAGRLESDLIPNGQEVMTSYADDRRVLSHGVPIVDEYRTQVSPDGRSHPSRVTKLPIFNEDRQVIGLLGFSTLPYELGGATAEVESASESRTEISQDAETQRPAASAAGSAIDGRRH